MQNGFAAADDQRVPGVVPALEAHHHLGIGGQPVHDFPFTFIAPLGANDDHVHQPRTSTCHVPSRRTSTRSQSVRGKSWLGNAITTRSPEFRSSAILFFNAASSECGAKI